MQALIKSNKFTLPCVLVLNEDYVLVMLNEF